MPASMMRRAMVYLGLADEDDEDEDPRYYGATERPKGWGGWDSQGYDEEDPAEEFEEQEEQAVYGSVTGGTIRPIRRIPPSSSGRHSPSEASTRTRSREGLRAEHSSEHLHQARHSERASGFASRSDSGSLGGARSSREEPRSTEGSDPRGARQSIRPVSASGSTSTVHVVAPVRFSDAKEVADRFMGNQPVIVNLQIADRELRRRMLDFCSGVAYSLQGAMEKVADQVFLLTPSNVVVPAEERRRLQEKGFVRH
jgi:cell division inhibitor SepF